jgi:hypothetical protein
MSDMLVTLQKPIDVKTNRTEVPCGTEIKKLGVSPKLFASGCSYLKLFVYI